LQKLSYHRDLLFAMIKIIAYFLLIFWLGCSAALAQNIHFSDYSHAPLVLSPAQSGAYHGSLRVGASYREQYRGFITPFQTTAIFVDSPLAVGLPDNQWVGVGVSTAQSWSGELSQKVAASRLGISYHLALDKKHHTTVGIGFQFIHSRRSLGNPAAARFEDQLSGLTTASGDQQLLDNFNSSYSGFNAGFYLKKRFNKKLRFEGGIGLDHLTKSSFVSTSGYVNEIPLKYNIYGCWSYRSSKKIILEPSVVFQRYGPVTNLLGIFGVHHKYNEDKNIILIYRLGYRMNDAAFLGVGSMFRNYTVSLTYDMTLSSARNYNGTTGALEIGVTKIFIIPPKVKQKLIELCPRL